MRHAWRPSGRRSIGHAGRASCGVAAPPSRRTRRAPRAAPAPPGTPDAGETGLAPAGRGGARPAPNGRAADGLGVEFLRISHGRRGGAELLKALAGPAACGASARPAQARRCEEIRRPARAPPPAAAAGAGGARQAPAGATMATRPRNPTRQAQGAPDRPPQELPCVADTDRVDAAAAAGCGGCGGGARAAPAGTLHVVSFAHVSKRGGNFGGGHVQVALVPIVGVRIRMRPRAPRYRPHCRAGSIFRPKSCRTGSTGVRR